MIRTWVISFVIFFILPYAGYAQKDIYSTDNGNISFFSRAPIEDIESKNNYVKAVLNTKTGEIAVLVNIDMFEFGKKLMKKHFNKQYMESEKFPQASFSGSISGFRYSELNSTNTEWLVKGILKIHGIENQLQTKVYLSLKDEILYGQTKFDIRLKDFDISIPRIIMKNISDNIEVNVDLPLEAGDD